MKNNVILWGINTPFTLSLFLNFCHSLHFQLLSESRFKILFLFGFIYLWILFLLCHFDVLHFVTEMTNGSTSQFTDLRQLRPQHQRYLFSSLTIQYGRPSGHQRLWRGPCNLAWTESDAAVIRGRRTTFFVAISSPSSSFSCQFSCKVWSTMKAPPILCLPIRSMEITFPRTFCDLKGRAFSWQSTNCN